MPVIEKKEGWEGREGGREEKPKCITPT